MENVRYALDRIVLAGHADKNGRHGGRAGLAFRFLVPERVPHRLRNRRARRFRKIRLRLWNMPEHGERGEERFSVEFHRADQSVWYDLHAFSRPGPTARLAYPFAQALQKRFAQESKEAMQRAMQRDGDPRRM